MEHALIRRARVALVGLAAAAACAAPAFVAPLATPASAVTYTSKPTITTQPTSAHSVINQTTFFEVSATRASTYQWQVQAPGSTTWKNMAGATENEVDFFADNRNDSGTHLRVAVSNNKGTVYSSVISITVWGYDAAHGVKPGAIWESGDWIGIHDQTDTNAGPELAQAAASNKPAKSGYTYVSTTIYVGNIAPKSATPWKTVTIGFVGNTGKVYGHCTDAFFDDDWLDTQNLAVGKTAYGQFCAMVPKGEIKGGSWMTLGKFQSGKTNKNVIFVKQS